MTQRATDTVSRPPNRGLAASLIACAVIAVSAWLVADAAATRAAVDHALAFAFRV